MITLLPSTKVLKKPHIPLPPANPQTLGEHIRKKRIESRQLQKEVAALWGVSEDSVTGWEGGRSEPQVRLMPRIIGYLGYYPFDHDTRTPAGMIDYCRHSRGWSYERLGKELGVHGSTVIEWHKRNSIADSAAQFQLVLLIN